MDDCRRGGRVDRDATAGAIRGQDRVEVGACGVEAVDSVVAVRPFASCDTVHHGISSEVCVRDSRARSGILVKSLHVHLDGYGIGQRVSSNCSFLYALQVYGNTAADGSSDMLSERCSVPARLVPNTVRAD